MFTRRGLFGFAAGGAVAAPILLKGEQVHATAVPLVHGEEPKELLPQVCIHIDGIEGDAHLRRLVREGIGQAMTEYHRDFSRRQDDGRARFLARKG